MPRKVYQTRSSNAKEKGKPMMWTNELDRCLSKILAEHSKNRHKADNIIKPATYAAAVAELNENFGLELNKDHIKNRLKTWRKQFSVLKEILAQKGFKWDKAQNMIVANDVVWNNYTKVHPEAKHLRSKVIDNFDELCIIAGNDQPTASCSDNGAEMDFDLMSDNEVVETPINSESQGDDKRAKNMRWTEEMDSWLGTILVEQVQKGFRLDNIIQSEVYATAVVALNEKFGPGLTKDHIKNRLKTLKKQYGIMKEILSHTGFKWDQMKKMINSHDIAWNDYVKTHHEARIFRGKAIEIYDHLSIIFGDNPSAGSYSRTADDIMHNIACDSEGAHDINAAPIRSCISFKDGTKNIRWTSEMDSYLGLILVEHAKLGNKSRLDNKFKPVAYDEAASALSGRFKLKLTRDHVRNRIEAWKKLYYNVKELLDQGQFKWDTKHKMVIANDSVWHEFIKINPEARLLQGQVIENYDNLREIVGDDGLTESSRKDAETDLNWAADYDAEAGFGYQNDYNSMKTKAKYMTWTYEMDSCLAEKLLEQAKLGNRLEKGFKHVAFTAACDALIENFGLDLTEEDIRSRLETWKNLYDLVKELLSEQGFEWDDTQKMVVANDYVWNEYIKMHPNANFLRGKSIENYDDLHILLGNNHIGGCATDLPSNNEEDLIENPLQNLMIDLEMSQENVGEGTQGSSQQTSAGPPSSSRSKEASKRRRSSDVMMEMMSVMAANIGRIADALTGNNQTVSLDELFEMVQKIPGFDDDLIIEACEFLSFDEKRAKMFLKLDERLRKLWLLKRLRCHTG